jgi:hypothetical protein
VKVSLSGFKELERALAEELPKATARNVLNRTAIEAMEPVRLKMAELAPYDPLDRDGNGEHLRDTMRTQVATAKLARKLGTERSAGVVVITGPAPAGKRARANAGWQELGTVKMGPNAYARPAADSEGDKVIQSLERILGAQLAAALERIKRSAARKAK